MASRYGITPDDLRKAALSLQIGEGISQRMASTEADEFIEDGETWAEDQISEYIAVPLKPTPAPGAATVPGTLTPANYPREFIKAAEYWAVARMLQSEFSETSPNATEYGTWAEDAAYRHISDFRSRRTTRVGAGRRRHPNPHMPPNIAPREDLDQKGFGKLG